MKCKLAIIGLLLFLVTKTFGQAWVAEENTFGTNWNISFQAGRTALLSEIKTDLSSLNNDMNNLSDWGINLQIGKMVWDQIDIGFELGYSTYKGYKNNSANVNWLMLHKQFNNETSNFQPYSIYYDSDLTNLATYVKYNFINFSSWAKGYLRLNVYTKLGIGIAYPSVVMGFSDIASYNFTGLSHPLYAMGSYDEPKRDAYSFFSLAFGVNYQLSDRVFFSAEASFQFIGADNLDGIHNYNKLLTPDVPDHLTHNYRIRVYDTTAKIMIGAIYFFNFENHRKERERITPWFAYRYRSYYSKYQRPSTRKAKQESLPFFNNKFNK